tara:strand:- start:1427 stop:6175 length:4749 start_codon:yes stop_codon:yes gene_type:complete
MAEVKNTFLKGRMNQDIDARILPEGEYREAINLLISRSAGSTVGEFENVEGNIIVGTGVAGSNMSIIGKFVDEITNTLYVFATNFSNTDSNSRATNANTCLIASFNLTTGTGPQTLVSGHFLNFNKEFPINQTNLVDTLLFFTDNFNQPRRIDVSLAANDSAFYQEENQISVAQYYPFDPIIPLERQTVTTVATGSDTLIEITVGNDNIKVGDIVTPNDKTEIVNFPIQNVLPPVRVTKVISNTEFEVSPAILPGALAAGILIDFSRTSMENRSDRYVSNYSVQTWGGNTNVPFAPADPTTQARFDDWVFGGFPRNGDLVENLTNPAASPASLRIKKSAFRVVGQGAPPPDNQFYIEFDQAHGFTNGDQIAFGVNPNYDSSFDGDTNYLDDRFVRFSYRFRFINNEYSLIAPFSQIMFIPKQQGQFGLGQMNTPVESGSVRNNYYQDENDAYTSTILEWFENDIDSIALNIPLPKTDGIVAKSSATNNLLSQFKVKEIDILYKESDAESIKVLDTINVSDIQDSQLNIVNYDDDINGLIDKVFYNYQYTSNKPYKTLPENQTVRVYDKVPIKALSQELISNRVVYGNYVQGMTPPESIEYTANWTERNYQTSDYSTEYPFSNVKQNRTYQVGFVLADYYGRQSDVILSSLDSANEFEGSTVYVPYRAEGDAIDAPVIDWIGRNLTLSISEQIGTEYNPSQGKPGLYRREGWVKATNLSDPGEGFIANKTYKAIGGSGEGLTIRVTEITGAPGEVDKYIIATAGHGYEVGDTVDLTGTVSDATLEITEIGEANPLGWYTYKVVVKQQEQEYYNVFLPGFVNGLPIQNQVWDGVSRQQVGPVSTNPSVEPIETQRGKIAFATLLSENVNKIPRSLNEVGPTDREFNSEEILFTRVNNPNATEQTNTGVRNLQYYPGQIQQNVLNIGTARETELAAIPFEAFQMDAFYNGTNYTTTGHVPCTELSGGAAKGFKGEYGSTTEEAGGCIDDGGDILGNVKRVPTGSIPYGDVADKQSFYGSDQNPFIMKIGQVNNFENPIGAIVCGAPLEFSPPPAIPHDTNYADGIRTMQPILSIVETKPVFSLLDIYWESTLSGDLETLNSSIASNYNGVIAASVSNQSFEEDLPSGTAVGSPFNFINGSGATATITAVSISSMYTLADPSSPIANISDYFTVNLPGANQAQIELAKEYWFRERSLNPGDDVYVLSLEVESTSGAETFTDTLTDALTLTLDNITPSIYDDAGYTNDVSGSSVTIPSLPDYPDTPPVTPSDIITLYGLNGSDDASNNKKQLIWSIESVLGGSVSDFELITGPVEGSVILRNTVEVVAETQYAITIKLEDADQGTGSLFTEVDILVTFGTQPAPKPIATGPATVFIPSTFPNRYLSTSPYPAFSGSRCGEFAFTNQSGSLTPYLCDGYNASTPSGCGSLNYYCWNLADKFDTLASPPGCPAGEKQRGDLFQGTAQFTVYFQKVTNTIGSVGSLIGEFNIQYRPNSSSAWANIDSVAVTKAPDPALDTTWLATQSVVSVPASPLDSVGDQYGYRYKFDQIGEYRILCKTSGSNGPDWGWYITYSDGTYVGSAAAPCIP